MEAYHAIHQIVMFADRDDPAIPLFSHQIVTVPMRVVGAVTSIVPVAGDAVHDAMDEAAEVVDKLAT